MVRVAPRRFDEWFPEGFQPDVTPQTADEEEALKAVMYLVVNVSDDPEIEAAVDELGALYGAQGSAAQAEFEAARPLILRALVQSPAVKRRRQLRSVARGIFPVLVDSFAGVDLRIYEESEEKPVLVPVAIARLNFDEPVGSNQSLSFQLTPESLDELIDTLSNTRELIRRSAITFAPWVDGED